MEEYSVQTGVKAEKALDSITAYLEENVSFLTAEKVYDALVDVIESLRNMPTQHSIEHNASNEKRTYRYARKWKYRIVFYINEEAKLVEVIDIVHGSQDLKNYFNQD